MRCGGRWWPRPWREGRRPVARRSRRGTGSRSAARRGFDLYLGHIVEEGVEARAADDTDLCVRHDDQHQRASKHASENGETPVFRSGEDSVVRSGAGPRRPELGEPALQRLNTPIVVRRQGPSEKVLGGRAAARRAAARRLRVRRGRRARRRGRRRRGRRLGGRRAARRGATAVVAVEAGALEDNADGQNTFFRRPPQLGHSVRASSVTFCTASRPSPHSVQWDR